MLALMDCIVTLPNHLGKMECRYLNHWQIVGFMKEGLRVFDLTTGTLSIPSDDRINHFVRTLRTNEGEIYVTRFKPFPIYEAANDELLINFPAFEGADVCYAAVKLNEEGERLIRALAEFQVDGDEIVKGLRALGVDIDMKVRKNFLGGWMITSSDAYTPEENQEGMIRLVETYCHGCAMNGNIIFTGHVHTDRFHFWENHLLSD